jgi:hypothetical protein
VSRRLLSGQLGQAKLEPYSAPYQACLYLATMCLRDGARDGKAETGAFAGVAPRGVDAVKAVEQVIEMVLADV